MAKRKSNTPNWAACRPAIKNWPAPGSRELIHELYQLSDENRRFLHARLLPQASSQTLAEAKRALKAIVSPDAIYGEWFSHADAKRIVDQFTKATDEKPAVAELLLADLEMSFKTFNQAGDYEPMVDHLYASLNRLDKLLNDLPPPSVAALVPRLTALAKRWAHKFGYGISDELTAAVKAWRERVERM